MGGVRYWVNTARFWMSIGFCKLREFDIGPLFQPKFLAVLKNLRDDRKMFRLQRINGLLFAPSSFLVGLGVKADLVKELGEDPVVVRFFGDGQVEIDFQVFAIGSGEVGDFFAFGLGPRSVEAQEL